MYIYLREAIGRENMEPKRRKSKQQNLAKHDLPQFYLLVVLYFVQGIPVGLAFGTVPFLLKSMAKGLSFTSLGLFSMATYPYSLKILWSPVVDSTFSKKIGRRRSWIIPIQLVSGLVLYALGWCISNDIIFDGVDDAYHGRGMSNTENKLENINIMTLVWYFGSLVFLCATQDIAVDGWALTILSKQSLSYASTAQTVGLNIGYFLSFTVFLALNSSEFVNKYFRTIPLNYGLVSLGGYLKFSGYVYLLVTFYIIFFTVEHPNMRHNSVLPYDNDKDMNSAVVAVQYDEYDVINNKNTRSLKYIYQCFWKVLKLKSVRSLVVMHLISKIAFQCNEAATNLKLLEKGFKREDLAVTVLIDVPFEIFFGYYVARWSSDSNTDGYDTEKDDGHGTILRDSKFKKLSIWRKLQYYIIGETGVLTPWLYGYLGRLLAAMLGSIVVYMFPSDGQLTSWYFLLIIIQHLLGSFMNTVQFVSISSFHTRIADPILGGTYMTLLNTVSNFGGTWPRVFIMYLVNWFTVYECNVGGKAEFTRGAIESCEYERLGKGTLYSDGYYTTNLICVGLGVLLYLFVLKKRSQQLQRLPVSSWRFT